MLNLRKQAEEIGIPESKLYSLYQLYISQTETDLLKLEDAIARENYNDTREMAHHIKGASLNLELTDLSRCSQEIIELCDGRREWSTTLEKARSLSKHFRELKTQLEQEEHDE